MTRLATGVACAGHSDAVLAAAAGQATIVAWRCAAGRSGFVLTKPLWRVHRSRDGLFPVDRMSRDGV